jgi:nucleoside-diphosphate-sugar epimerase
VKVALIGGSGYVGGLVLPYLCSELHVRVVDVNPPVESHGAEYVCASVADEPALKTALTGLEGVVYMAMQRELQDVDANYDMHVKNLHRTLLAAAESGIRRGVYLSSMSVYAEPEQALPDEEDTPTDSSSLYGLTKHLGEMVCAHFARRQGMDIVALRLNNPLSPSAWQRCLRSGHFRMHTAAPDVAEAIVLALRSPVRGFHAVNIAGDWHGHWVNCRRAFELLGWKPRSRPNLLTRFKRPRL